ncbi:MAG: helix-turn-helix transcriptional regulator [Thermoleophilia bacterium]
MTQRLGGLLPPLNAGQIYTTLQRLERDGLVSSEAVPEDGRNKRMYAITEAGRCELERWASTPVPGTRLKDEFFMKLVLVGLGGLVDPKRLIDAQRREYLQSLRDLTEVVRGEGSEILGLLADGAAFRLEADLRWLDLCERRLVQKEER